MLCVVSLLLTGISAARAEFDLRDLWSASDTEKDNSEDVRNKTPPLGWLSGGYRPEQVLYFSGFDLQRYGFGGYVGAVWSPLSGADGFLLKLFAADGIDSYRSQTTLYRSETMRAALTPGYRISRSGFELSAFAGLEVLGRFYLPITKTTRLQPDFGMRLSTDLWWEPLNAVMIAANLSMTTIDASFYGRLATGIRILDVWTGPEISASTDMFGQQYRVGAHVTSLRHANYEFSAAAGYACSAQNRMSPRATSIVTQLLTVEPAGYSSAGAAWTGSIAASGTPPDAIHS